jgi:hypothetical protein
VCCFFTRINDSSEVEDYLEDDNDNQKQKLRKKNDKTYSLQEKLQRGRINKIEYEMTKD